MKNKDFISRLDDDRIVAAISAAERRTSGEIRIFVSGRRVHDALAAAQVQFARLGMEKTRERNGVLLYFAPVTQQFAIVGDAGVHEKCGDQFWQAVASEMTSLLKRGQFSEAAIEAISRVGELLARHFPRRPEDQNELPDRVERD